MTEKTWPDETISPLNKNRFGTNCYSVPTCPLTKGIVFPEYILDQYNLNGTGGLIFLYWDTKNPYGRPIEL